MRSTRPLRVGKWKCSHSPETLSYDSSSLYTLLLFGSHGTDSTMPYAPWNKSLLITSASCSHWLKDLPLYEALTITFEDLIMQGPNISISQFLKLLIPDDLHSPSYPWLYPVLFKNQKFITYKSQLQTSHSLLWPPLFSFLPWPHWTFRSMDPPALVLLFCFCLYFCPPFTHTSLDFLAHPLNYPVAKMLGLLDLFFHSIHLQDPSPIWTWPSTSPVSMPEPLIVV